MSRPDTLSMGELSAMLAERVEDVAHRFAPAVSGSHTVGDDYFTLNPFRPDKTVGSFKIAIGGARQGRWIDFATGESGDLLDLIQRVLNCDKRGAVLEARAYLGLTVASAEVTAQRKAAAEAARARHAERARRIEADMEAKRRRAHGLWLSGQAITAGCPVGRYLAARGIDLSRLDRMPGSLRYLPDAFYSHTDTETGEVIEGRFPAMVACAHDRGGKVTACHRTYLALRRGVWGKADVPAAKKVLGLYAGSAIRVWSGAAVDGRRPVKLAKVAPGAHVFLAEGIEDALSCAMVLPSARVLAAISLSNLANVALPPNVTTLTLIADQDDGAEARAALDRAVAAHAKAGREVRIWRNRLGGKDLNDALRGDQEGAA